MTYKIKSKKIPKGYFEEKEIERLRKKYKGKLPPFTTITRAGTRYVAGIQKKVHREGSMILYKDKIARIDRVTEKGIWITPFKTNGITTPTKEIIFIPEKRVEREVYPYFLGISI
jgi:hypothetical protein